MRCPSCGSDNPDTSAFCTTCGKELPFPGLDRSAVRNPPLRLLWKIDLMGRSGVPVLREGLQDAGLCEAKGGAHQHRDEGPPLLIVPIAGFIIGAIYYTKPEKEYKHVGKICIVLGVVGILLTVALAAIMYVMVLALGGITTNTPAANVLRKASILNGYRIEFTAPTFEVKWSDVTIQLSEGWYTASWGNVTTHDLTGTPPVVWHCGSSKALGPFDVFLSITDLSGDGRMGYGDYITLTVASGEAFSSIAIYTLTLLYEPTDGAMLSYDFSG